MSESRGSRSAACTPPAAARRGTRVGPEPSDGREDIRTFAYASLCRRRLLRCLPPRGERLLQWGAAPFGDSVERELAARFRTRYCIDDSPQALDGARRTIGGCGVFLNGAFLEVALDDDSFDGAICIQAIDRLDPAGREAAVRKLLRVTRPGGRVVIVPPRGRPGARAAASGSPSAVRRPRPGRLRLSWYRRFEDIARVGFLPGRSFAAGARIRWLPPGALRRGLLSALYRLEESFPRSLDGRTVRPLVVLTRTPAVPKPVPDGYPPARSAGGRAGRRLFV